MKMRLFLAALMGLLLTACATIPQETVDLSKKVTTGLQENQKTVDALIDANIKSDIERYRAQHRNTVWHTVAGLVTVNLLAKQGKTPADLAAGRAQLTGQDHQAIGRVQRIMDGLIEDRIRSAWEETRKASRNNTVLLVSMNQAVTKNVEAHRTLQLKQAEVLSATGNLLGIDVSKTQQAVDEVLAGGLEALIDKVSKQPDANN